MENKNTTVLQIAMRWGMIGGVAAVVLLALKHFLGLTSSADGINVGAILISLLSLAVTIAVIYKSMIQHRDDNYGGEISFNNCIGVGILTSLFKGIIVALWTFIYYKFLAPDAIDELLNTMYNMLEGMGQDEEALDMVMGIYETIFTPIGQAISTITSAPVGGAILSLIIAMVISTNKKDNVKKSA